MIRDVIKKKLTEPHLVPQDRKMIDMVDELVRSKISKSGGDYWLHIYSD